MSPLGRKGLALVCVLVAAAFWGAKAPPAWASNYGIFFSGGGDPATNHTIYHDETVSTFNGVAAVMAFDPYKMYVLAADGMCPGVDQDNGTSSDWSSLSSYYGGLDYQDHVRPGTWDSLVALLPTLHLGRADQLLFWVHDHGGRADYGGSRQSCIIGWGPAGGNTDMWAPDFTRLMYSLKTGRQVFNFNECYSGGMVQSLDLAGSATRFAGASCGPEELSHSGGLYDTYSGQWQEAIAGRGGPHCTRAWDIYAYAADNHYSSNGDEHPMAAGNGDLDLHIAEWQGTEGSTVYSTHWHDSWWSRDPTINRAVDIHVGNVDISTAAQAGLLTVDSYAVNAPCLSLLAGGTLTSQAQTIGDLGPASFIQEGGTNTLSDTLTLGDKPGGHGTYDQRGGTLQAGTLWIGRFGQGEMTQAADVTVSQAVWLGVEAGGDGTYRLSGGTLQTGGAYVGEVATGHFIQGGGSHRADNLYLGAEASGAGTYELNDGHLIVGTEERIGDLGQGDFVQRGGDNSAGGLYIANRTLSSRGSYSLSGGTLTVEEEVVGRSGSGVFDQSGGTNTAHRFLSVGQWNHSHGTFGLHAGGLVEAPNEYIGDWGNGTFNHDGGTNAVGSTLFVGLQATGHGRYNLSGAGNLTAPNEIIGHAYLGDFYQSGGTNTVDSTVTVGNLHTAVGSYHMSGGALAATDLVIGQAGSGEFFHTGGAVRLTGDLNVGNADGGIGAYSPDLAADLHAFNIRVGVAGTGTVNQSGGSVTATNYLFVGYSPTGVGTYNLGGGDASAALVSVGYQGEGHFRQTSGRLFSTHDLYVGDNPTGSGDYRLEGGEVHVAGDAYVGCSSLGVFFQYAGSLSQVGGNLHVGYLTGATGRYLIYGGTLDVRNHDITLGGLGAGTLEAHGGTVIADRLLLWPGGTLDARGRDAVLRVNELVGFGSTPTINATLQFGQSGGAGHGDYTVDSRGVLAVRGDLVVGYDAPATLDQTADRSTVSVTGTLVVGEAAGSNGQYALDGPNSYLWPTDEYIGHSGGTGVLAQTDGWHNVCTRLSVGTNGTGTLNFNGGRLDAPEIVLGGNGTGEMNWRGGTLNTNSVTAGRHGTLNVTAGNWTYGGALAVAGGTVDLGTLDLILDGFGQSAHLDTGAVRAGRIIVGNTTAGSFAQYYGSASTATELRLAAELNSQGEYSIGAGNLGGVFLVVGGKGKGRFTQGGGESAFTGGVTLGEQPGADGTYTAGGGTLRTGVLKVGAGGRGTLDITSPDAGIFVSSRLTIGADGVVRTVPGAAIHMTGSLFENKSTHAGDLDGLANLALIFEGGPTNLDTFEAAGRDFGLSEQGFKANFALGTLQVGGDGIAGLVQLVDAIDNQPGWNGTEALYVDDLTLTKGAVLDVGAINVYCHKFISDATSTVISSGGSVMITPEPATLTLLGLGGLALLRRRRWASR